MDGFLALCCAIGAIAIYHMVLMALSALFNGKFPTDEDMYLGMLFGNGILLFMAFLVIFSTFVFGR